MSPSLPVLEAPAPASAAEGLFRVFDSLCVNGSARFKKGELTSMPPSRVPTDVRTLFGSLPLRNDAGFRGRLNPRGASAQGSYYRLRLPVGQFYAAVELRQVGGDVTPVRVCSVVGSRIAPRYAIERLGLPVGDVVQQKLSDAERGFADWNGVPSPGYRYRVSLWGLQTMLQSVAPELRSSRVLSVGDGLGLARLNIGKNAG